MLLCRRWVLKNALWVTLAAIGACSGGASSTLNTVRSPTGSGAIDFAIQNKTDVPINNLYLAKARAVEAAGRIEPDSQVEQDLWGTDYLTRGALEVGGRMSIPITEADTYDARVLDRDAREQHVSGLKLGPGGRYILELGEGGWRLRK